MPAIFDFSAQYSFLVFFIPGAILLYVYSRFTIGRLPPPGERLLSYLVVSTIYLFITLPFIRIIFELSDRTDPNYYVGDPIIWVCCIVWLFGIPAISGFGIAKSGSTLHKLFLRFRLTQLQLLGIGNLMRAARTGS